MGSMFGGMAFRALKDEGRQQREAQPAGFASLSAVLESMCARGFLRQVTALCMVSKELAEAAPMGTIRQIHNASRDGHDAKLTTYLAF